VLSRQAQGSPQSSVGLQDQYRPGTNCHGANSWIAMANGIYKGLSINKAPLSAEGKEFSDECTIARPFH
jgi:hypothetical protein